MNDDMAPKPKEHKSNELGSVRAQMIQECVAMTRHALASGLQIPGKLLKVLELAEGTENNDGKKTETALKEISLQSLGKVHDQLARIVEPATPRTILLLSRENEKTGIFAFLGRVPLVRRMMFAAIFWLTCFVTLSLSPDVNESGGNILNDAGLSLLTNLVFFVSAAGLGAAFAALFQANRYVVEGTFDPKFESSYWIRFILGIIAGMLLAVLIPLDTGDSGVEFGKPLLAMLGGFSAAVVHRILTRLVDTVESLVRGSSEDMIKAREKAAQIRAEEQHAESRMKTASKLMELRTQIGSGVDSEQLGKTLDRLMGDIMPVTSEIEENETV